MANPISAECGNQRRPNWLGSQNRCPRPKPPDSGSSVGLRIAYQGAFPSRTFGNTASSKHPRSLGSSMAALVRHDDPSEFRKPFTTREVRSLAPKDWEILEYVCNENEKDIA